MPSKGLSFRDAARILGDDQNKVISALDKLLGGLLLVTAPVNPAALSLLDAKSEFIGIIGSLWRGLAEKTNGLSNLDKTQRISAAHAVIVIASYFETICQLDDRVPLQKIRLPGPGESSDPSRTSTLVSPSEIWPHVPEPVTITLMRAYRRRLAEAEKAKPKVRGKNQKLTRSEQVALATKRGPETEKFGSVVAAMLNADLPIPAPQRPYEATLADLGDFYEALARDMRADVVGAEWDKSDPKEWDSFTVAFQGWVRSEALAKYEANFRQLAVQFPEIAFWANMTNFRALQAEVYEVRQHLSSLEDIQLGLQGLEQALYRLDPPAEVSAKHRQLADYYQKALARPIVESGEIPASGMRIPDLGSAYVNPNFKTSDVEPNDSFYTESWWDEPSRQVRSDLQKFLFGYLKSPQAVDVPVLVLGQPGSGKSVLTKTIAARLPREEFFVIRVSLREVAAEADIQVQIEQAVYNATGERVSWPDLARESTGKLPVVILDGFDELLQTTGVSQSDYLERVAMFQERESANNFPCVVMVTSRTAVADRARVPLCGIVVVRLEPFSEEQISLWLNVWNSWNADYFRSRGLRDLQLNLVLSHGELAAQPLLLLMLALYDADGNALEEYSSGLGHAQLYERLIVRFAERDARKLHSRLPSEEIGRQVKRDLMQLSVAAAAMFNRSRQWVTEDELNADLMAFQGRRTSVRKPSSTSTFQAVRTPGETVLGQFFFIHEARALVGGTKRGSFEFLHATFGEFLVARIVSSELEDLVKSEEFVTGMARRGEIRDSFLYSLLSFSPLSARATTIDFLADLLDAWEPERRLALRALLLQLFQVVLEIRTSDEYEDYEPVTLGSPARYATYSANLIVLILLTAAKVRASELFSNPDDVISEWRRLALLWRSQLSAEGWQWLSEAVRIERVEVDGRRDLMLSSALHASDQEVLIEAATANHDRLRWAVGMSSAQPVTSWTTAESPHSLMQRYRFTCSWEDEIVMHAIEPLFEYLGFSTTTFSTLPDKSSVSCANAFMRLFILSATRAPSTELASAYDDCIHFCLPDPSVDAASARMLRDIVIRQLGYDLKRLPGLWRASTRERLLSSGGYSSDAGPWIDSLVASLGLR